MRSSVPWYSSRLQTCCTLDAYSASAGRVATSVRDHYDSRRRCEATDRSGGSRILCRISRQIVGRRHYVHSHLGGVFIPGRSVRCVDRKSTRLNSSHLGISYAVFCLKKKKSRYHSNPL